MVISPKGSSSFRPGHSFPPELLEILSAIPFLPAQLVAEGAVFHIRQFFQATAEDFGFMTGQ